MIRKVECKKCGVMFNVDISDGKFQCPNCEQWYVLKSEFVDNGYEMPS